MKHLKFEHFLPGIIGIGMTLIAGIAILTFSFVFAAPTEAPPGGNPTFPLVGPEGPTGIVGFRIVENTQPSNTFAVGINVACDSATEYAVGCSSTCDGGSEDTVAYPVNNYTCRGHEPDDNSHFSGNGTCTLYAHCLQYQ